MYGREQAKVRMCPDCVKSHSQTIDTTALWLVNLDWVNCMPRTTYYVRTQLPPLVSNNNESSPLVPARPLVSHSRNRYPWLREKQQTPVEQTHPGVSHTADVALRTVVSLFMHVTQTINLSQLTPYIPDGRCV